MDTNHFAATGLLCATPCPIPEMETAIARFLKDIEKCPSEIRLSPCCPGDPLVVVGAELALAEMFWEPVLPEFDLVHLCQLILPVAAQAPFIAYELLSPERAAGPHTDDASWISGSAARRRELETLRACLALAGIARLAEHQAHDYAKLRQSGKKPIWTYQSIGRRLSDALMDSMMARFVTLVLAKHVTAKSTCEWSPTTLSRLIIHSTTNAVHAYQLITAGHGFLRKADPALLHRAALQFGQELRSCGSVQ